MFLASTGQLKHKRTRNTIAAEPTPRSSCPSSADAAASSAHAAGAAASDPSAARRNVHVNGGSRRSNPAPRAANKVASSGSALGEFRTNSGANSAEADHGMRLPEDVGGLCPRSHPRLLMSAVYRQEGDSDHDDLSASPKTSVERRPSRAARRAASPDRRDPEGTRPQSAGGAVGRRPRSPVKSSVGTVRRHATQDDTPTRWRAGKEVPLHVGPEIVAPSVNVARACVGREERSTAVRRRPASAGGGVAAANKTWGAELQSRARVVHRGFGERGRGGRGRNGGGGGDRIDRAVRRKRGGMARPTPKARAPGGESTARTPGGSFAESVIKSARPFADYDYITATKARPKSAGAATNTTVVSAAPAFDPGSRESHALAAETRLMPVGAIHKAFKGRRLAAVQAWDPQAAAAVRAARAETLLRRKRLGRAGPAGAPASAAASDREQPGEAGVDSRNRDEELRCRHESEGGRRLGSSSSRRACGKGRSRGGEAVDRRDTTALGKECRR